MKLLDIINGAWALEAQNLIEIQGIFQTHLRGDKIDIVGVEARLGRPLANEQKKYTVREGGVAVLAVEGVLAPKANLFTEISGGASTQMLGNQMRSAMADSSVRSLVLEIDSPGGSVFGTPELSDIIFEGCKVKPIISVATAQMCSGALWVGTSANASYLSSPMVQAGSLGVVMRRSYQPADASGPVVEEITAGKYKRVGSPDKPLNKDEKAYYQAQADHMYVVFATAMAKNLGVSVDIVLDRMADGRVFIGQQAIDCGLVSGFSTVDAMVEQLATNPAKFASRRKAVFAVGSPSPKPAGAQAAAITNEPVSLTPVINLKGSTMDMKELKEQHPALFAHIETENAAAVAAATTAGATAEAARISGVRATTLPGHEKLVETLAFDGKTTPAEAALAVNAAHRASLTAAAAAHAADAPKALPHAAAKSDAGKTRTEMAAEASAYAKQHSVSVVDACKALGFAV